MGLRDSVVHAGEPEVSGAAPGRRVRARAPWAVGR